MIVNGAKYKNILIAGLGRTGAACARFLKKRGANITITDIAQKEKLKTYLPMMHELGVKLELGCHRVETFENADMVIISPGISHTILPVKCAREKKIPVISEIELAYRFINKPIVAVTGTNGKTTTTTLLGKMMENSGFKVFVGGNIGNPLIEYADMGEKADIIIVEVSSFQLDTIDTFRPKVSVLLNITEDHLDRYPGLEHYARSKGRIFKNQQENDTAVLNGSDPLVVRMAENIKAEKKFFYRSSKVPDEIKKLNFSMPGLKGVHNIENACAAALAALAANGTIQGIQIAISDFKGLSHRLEYVTTVNGVLFYDDSKATNTDAVKRALETFDRPVVLIMGGRDKGGGYDCLKDPVQKHVKKLIVMGEAKENIESDLGKIVPVQIVNSMEEAVFFAFKAATCGDVVLLSPGCSSFDMFDSYAQRGEIFAQAVFNI